MGCTNEGLIEWHEQQRLRALVNDGETPEERERKRRIREGERLAKQFTAAGLELRRTGHEELALLNYGIARKLRAEVEMLNKEKGGKL